ncbi:phospho-sugar mutase [Candidatus Saccharibacteria bacterium]|jgi:phosphoglucomutase/phosphomannomutase|nr:phospho-sugar mutase [Candidatus Saccharibacteria bacterium]
MQPIDLIRGNVSEQAEANIVKWLTQSKYADYADELSQMIQESRWQELEDAFFKDIEFGTGGRRGTTGVGSNRINRVTIGESAQALCRYAASIDDQAPQKGVVIACDTRLSSDELSRFTAQVCAANGFKVYIFDRFRATPELSFAVRHLGASVGVVISASHNPPADNGFKAYWSDGSQIVPPHDHGVINEASHGGDIQSVGYDEALHSGKIEIISDEVDQAYIQAVVDESMTQYRDVSIIYSPLHGAGQASVLPVLQKAGFEDINTVSQQMVPDGSFPTIPSGKPNPEEKSANDMAVQKMIDERADIAITNDPDADRIGVVVRQGSRPIYLNGNQSAALVADFVLHHMSEKGLTSNHYIAKTIVTTDLLNALARSYGINIYDNMLIGFKYIGELIRNKENTNEKFVLGGEESYGLLKGTYARDKDGAVGALLLAEYAAELKSRHMTLFDRLMNLFCEHGIYSETLVNIQLPGSDGFNKMQSIMQNLRQSPPKVLAGYEVSAVQDYQSLQRRDIHANEIEEIDCIKGDVLVFELGESRRRVTVRPSGTEPKLKLYIQWHEDVEERNRDSIEDQYNKLLDNLTTLGESIEEQITAA